MEKKLHKAIVEYINLQYPATIFNTDLSGLRLTIGQAKVVKKLRSNNSFPDIVIYKKNQTYGAMFIEVKIEPPYKMNGDIKKKYKPQNDMLEKLNKKGYYAIFGYDFCDIKNKIDWYMSLS